MNLTEVKIPQALTCPTCGKPIQSATQTRSGAGPVLKKGSVFICGHCSAVMRLGDSNLERMTPDQVNALSKESKAAIAATKLAIVRILQKASNRPSALS
jgi:ribosomal protein L34E